MSTPTYLNEKQEPGHVGALDSDGSTPFHTLTALIAEGENPFDPAC
jgi:hypothetical protein